MFYPYYKSIPSKAVLDIFSHAFLLLWMSLQIYMDQNLLIHGADSTVQDKPYNIDMCRPTSFPKLTLCRCPLHEHDERNFCPFFQASFPWPLSFRLQPDLWTNITVAEYTSRTTSNTTLADMPPLPVQGLLLYAPPEIVASIQ